MKNHDAVCSCSDMGRGLATWNMLWPCGLTCLHLAIQCSRTIQDEALDLQELIRLVPSNHREAKASTAFPKLRVNELAFQLRGVSCKKRFAWFRLEREEEKES